MYSHLAKHQAAQGKPCLHGAINRIGSPTQFLDVEECKCIVRKSIEQQKPPTPILFYSCTNKMMSSVKNNMLNAGVPAKKINTISKK